MMYYFMPPIWIKFYSQKIGKNMKYGMKYELFAPTNISILPP